MVVELALFAMVNDPAPSPLDAGGRFDALF